MARDRAPSWWHSAVVRYVGTTALVVTVYEAAATLSHHFVPAAASMFILCIIVSAWLGGTGAGFWAVALSLAAFRYGFVVPRHSFFISSIDTPRMVLFSLTTVTVGVLGGLQNRTAKSLKRAQRTLERTIDDLTQANQALHVENAEHRRIAAELRISEALLAEGEKMGHSGSWRWRPDDQTLAWSDEHFRIYGLPPHSYAPSVATVYDSVHPDDAAALRDVVTCAVRQATAFECEYRIVLADGTIRHLLGTGRPAHSEGRAVVEYIGITADITARKKAELSLVQSQRLIQDLHDRRETAREDERKHLARELHDDLAQTLLALRLQLAGFAYEFSATLPGLADRARAMTTIVDESIGILRGAISNLRPVALDVGVLAALEWLADQFSVENHLPCRWRCDLASVQLPEKSTIGIFRIAQEALRNVARHAQASAATVTFKCSNNRYILEIADDGCGFDSSARPVKSFGLVGIMERASALGGTLRIDTAPGSGTTVCLDIPIHVD